MHSLAIAEQAADWCVRLPAATQKENVEFMVWLRESPLHVREFLLAMRTERRLRRAGLHLTLDVDSLQLKAQQNIVTFSVQGSQPERANDGAAAQLPGSHHPPTHSVTSWSTFPTLFDRVFRHRR